MNESNHGSDSIIRIEGVSKRFGGNVVAVDDVHLDIYPGEFFALLGPSGCGKTTLLRMLAGFEAPSDGRVIIDGQDMAGVEPNRRNVNMVFQSYAVFPHMNVFDNVAYGLKVSGSSRAEIPGRVEEALSLVKLEGFARRRPDQLSGGQRQRVALARALVKRPRVLLLDEPLSALDAKLREAMQLELVNLQENVGITFVIVTHDQDEALSMADRIAVMDGGRVRQVAPPHRLYEAPVDRFVADFIGKMNLLKATRVNGSSQHVEFEGPGGFELQCPEEVSRQFAVALRPEKIRLHTQCPEDTPGIETTVEAVVYHGSESRVYTRTSNGVALSVTLPNSSRTPSMPGRGDPVWLTFSARDLVILED